MLLILHLSINNVAKVGIFFELNKKISEKYSFFSIFHDLFFSFRKKCVPLHPLFSKAQRIFRVMAT